MEYMTALEASEKWNISVRRIQILCKEGRIPDAKMFGHNWAIPVDAEKPNDERIKSGQYVKKRTEDLPIINDPSEIKLDDHI